MEVHYLFVDAAVAVLVEYFKDFTEVLQVAFV